MGVLETHCTHFLLGPGLKDVYDFVVFATDVLIFKRVYLLGDSVEAFELYHPLLLNNLLFTLHFHHGLLIWIEVVFLDCIGTLLDTEYSVSIEVAQQSFFFDSKLEFGFETVKLLEFCFDSIEFLSSAEWRLDIILWFVYKQLP